MLLRDMGWEDVDAVLEIEQQVHSHPWTRGNFNDALATGNLCKVYQVEHELIGYAVLMPALDDIDLLDICIAAAHQRKGLGTQLLDALLTLSRSLNFSRVILEVRRSNLSACALYRKAGFTEIGLRRDYYPTSLGREDALVMAYQLK
jgi:ribosomal-protein-alanine N-acetyltransferase